MNIKCYDNGGKTADRYTVVYLDYPERSPNTFAAVGMDNKPFHPQGFGQHTTATPGRHLGKRIAFEKLPEDCQKLVRQDLPSPQQRLEYLRGELRAERISQGELGELQALARYIAPGDVELLEAAGVPEMKARAGA